MKIKAIWILVTVMALVVTFTILSHRRIKTAAPQPTKVTVDSIVYDTIPYMLPLFYDSVVIRYDTVTLALAESRPIVIKEQEMDSVVYQAKDSASVVIPITQKEYGDSTYYARISGYNPILEEIRVYQRTVYQTVEATGKSKKFGVGIQAGYGASKDGLSPYFGVGIHYNIFSW